MVNEDKNESSSIRSDSGGGDFFERRPIRGCTELIQYKYCYHENDMKKHVSIS